MKFLIILAFLAVIVSALTAVDQETEKNPLSIDDLETDSVNNNNHLNVLRSKRGGRGGYGRCGGYGGYGGSVPTGV
ncbi:hypothetical protein ACKWTF_016685 [Chironomus riparius]